MKKIKAILLIFAAGVFLSSCTNWLDLKPVDQILDEELYSTERGTNKALNGLYLSMADASLYGKNLSYYTIELLGQRYNGLEYTPDVTGLTNKEMSALPYYDYTHKDVKSHLDNIFSKAYNVIRDANYYIDQVEKSNVVTGDKKNILLGEGYAIRAFLHFDMLRFYGQPPVLDQGGKGVPYYTKATNIWETPKTVGKVIELVIKDIDKALELLVNDPIQTDGVILKSDDYDFIKPFRNRRLNYFAVKALKARVLFYSGDATMIAQAGEIAKELIESEAFQKAFPWEDTPGLKEPEFSVFSHEVMFGIHVASMYTDWDKWFNISIRDNRLVLPTVVKTLNYMYGTTAAIREDATEMKYSTGDYRAGLWRESILAPTRYMSVKFMKPSSPEHHKNFQPLMRKSELYLIASEVYQSEDYIDELRIHRNVGTLEGVFGGEQVLQDEIRREYMKEFVSEGQLFYYYKRRAEENIWGRSALNCPNTTSTNGNNPGDMTVVNPKASYTPPMPKTETDV